MATDFLQHSEWSSAFVFLSLSRTGNSPNLIVSTLKHSSVQGTDEMTNSFYSYLLSAPDNGATSRDLWVRTEIKVQTDFLLWQALCGYS